mmetsp:Transcript_2006/g.6445  ORF Transcript_2006/g.6445 Transcript_2006/m.6445 type:complete len:204 (+) Transcript_2006:473-1084(+)
MPFWKRMRCRTSTACTPRWTWAAASRPCTTPARCIATSPHATASWRATSPSRSQTSGSVRRLPTPTCWKWLARSRSTSRLPSACRRRPSSRPRRTCTSSAACCTSCGRARRPSRGWTRAALHVPWSRASASRRRQVCPAALPRSWIGARCRRPARGCGRNRRTRCCARWPQRRRSLTAGARCPHCRTTDGGSTVSGTSCRIPV